MPRSAGCHRESGWGSKPHSTPRFSTSCSVGGVCCLPEGRLNSSGCSESQSLTAHYAMRLIPACQEAASPPGRRSSASSQGPQDDGFARNARSFLGNSDRWEHGQGASASGSMSSDPAQGAQPGHQFDCSTQVSACKEVPRLSLVGIDRVIQPKVNPEACFRQKDSGADVQLSQRVAETREERVGFGQHGPCRKGLRARPRRRKPGLSGGAPKSGFGPTEEVTAGRSSLTTRILPG